MAFKIYGCANVGQITLFEACYFVKSAFGLTKRAFGFKKEKFNKK